MSTYEDLYTRVQTVVRDTSSTTLTLIQSYLKDIIQEMVSDVNFPELYKSLDITIGTGAYIDFSATTDLRVYNIEAIRDPDGSGSTISILPRNLFDNAQVDQDSSSGYPQFATVRDETSLNVWPYGSSSVWSVKYKALFTDFSASSQVWPLSQEAFKVTTDGAIAELMDFKDDNRADKYALKYEIGKKRLKKKYAVGNYMDIRMQPDNVSSRHDDWERIFGDN